MLNNIVVSTTIKLTGSMKLERNLGKAWFDFNDEFHKITPSLTWYFHSLSLAIWK